MNRFTIVFVFAALPWLAAAQQPEKHPDHFVALQSKFEDEIKLSASGIIVSPKRVITTYHFGELWESTVLPESQEEAEYVAANPRHDFLVLEFGTAPFEKDFKPVTVGPAVVVGEHIHCWGNPLAIGVTYREFTVAKVTDVHIVLDRSLVIGESGAGCYNERNELIGMASGHIGKDHEALGVLIPVAYFAKHIPATKR